MSYKDEIIYNIMSINVFYFILEKYLQFDKKNIDDGRMNAYTLVKNSPKDFLVLGKQFLRVAKQVKKIKLFHF